MIIVYAACILNYAHNTAVFDFFSINSTVSRAMPIVVNEVWLSWRL